MIVVSGGAGFIGSNLIGALNRRGRTDIVLIEDFSDGRKSANLADCTIGDYHDWREALGLLEAGCALADGVECIYHFGACSDTTEWDGRYMMETNYRFSRALLHYAAREGVPFVYASSAAVYGAGRDFREVPACERPLNMYGYSKLAFDQFVRRCLPDMRSPVLGLRFFNVYGPREQHKGRMASVVWHFHQQLRQDGVLRLFGASHGYGAGEQQRDFIHVDDAVAVALWCAEQPAAASGIYNCGTGRAETFNRVAGAIVDWAGGGEIVYRDFPPDLAAAYQAYTCADLTRLRTCGYTGEFMNVRRGVEEYLNWLSC